MYVKNAQEALKQKVGLIIMFSMKYVLKEENILSNNNPLNNLWKIFT